MKAARTLVIWVLLAATAHAGISVTQVGFTNGDDWEPAIAVDGQYVYVTWAHFGTPVHELDHGRRVRTVQQLHAHERGRRDVDE